MARNQCAIRKARSADLAELTELAERTFRDTFAVNNRKGDVDAYVSESLSLRQYRAELSDPKNVFLLAYVCESEKIIGFAKLRANSSHSRSTAMRPIEISQLYVDKNFVGTGVGAMMMQACLNYANTASCDEVWLGVWEKNQRAIEFYERWEFGKSGTQPFVLGSDTQNDLIMSRSV